MSCITPLIFIDLPLNTVCKPHCEHNVTFEIYVNCTYNTLFHVCKTKAYVEDTIDRYKIYSRQNKDDLFAITRINLRIYHIKAGHHA